MGQEVVPVKCLAAGGCSRVNGDINDRVVRVPLKQVFVAAIVHCSPRRRDPTQVDEGGRRVEMQPPPRGGGLPSDPLASLLHFPPFCLADVP